MLNTSAVHLLLLVASTLFVITPPVSAQETSDQLADNASRPSQQEVVIGLRKIFAENLIEEGSFAEAEEKLRQNVAELEALFGVLDERTLNANLDLAELLRIRGKFRDAEVLLFDTLKTANDTLSGSHPVILQTLDTLAIVYDETARYDEAQEVFEQLVSARESANGIDDLRTLNTVNNFGILSMRQGNYRKAERLHQRALEGRSQQLGAYDEATLSSINNLAIVYDLMGRHDEAEPLLLNLLAELRRTQGDMTLGTIAATDNLAAYYVGVGRYGEAEPLYLDVRNKREALLGPRHPDTIASQSNLAEMYIQQGRFAEAEAVLIAALAVASEELTTGHPTTLVITSLLADALKELQRYAEAKPYYTAAIEGATNTLGAQHPVALNASGGLAIMLRDTGEFARSDELFASVHATTSAGVGESHPSSIRALVEWAKSKRMQGDLDDGERKSYRALALADSSLPNGHPLFPQINFELAEIFSGRENPARSVFFYKRAVNNLQSLRQNMEALSPTTQKAFLEKWKEVYERAQAALISEGRMTEAEQVGRMLKEVEYTLFVRGARDADPGAQLALTHREREWEAQLSGWLETPNQLAGELAALRRKKREGGGLSPLEERQLVDLDAAHGAAYEEFFARVNAWTSDSQAFDSVAIEREVSALALEESRAVRRLVGNIGADVALLQAVAFEDSLHLFFITGEAFVHEEVPVSRSDLFAAIFEARQLIDEGRSPDIASAPGRAAELHAPLGELYQWLVAPLEDELAAAGTKTLMLNLQGQIRYLPFAALWDGEAYLTEKLHLALYTPAANTRYDAPPALSRAQGFGLSNATEGFSPLPSVPLELQYVIGSDEQPGVLRGDYVLNEGFNQASFEEGLADPAPVVHLATHFQIEPGDEASSYLLLGDGSRISVAAINRSYKYDFTGVELLTLSACETALGAKGTGMEIEGFGALAQNKGAASVVATLWQVSDDAAPEIMRSFYSGMVQDGLTKAGAMQQAQLELIASEKFSDPFYWAPFVIMGNWR